MQFTAGSSRLQAPSLLLVAVVACACSATGSGTHGPSPTTSATSSSGTSSAITVDGKHVTMYHYSATLEFPYFIGCFHGTSTSLR